MAIIQSFHQFEIRFTPILNFHILSRTIIAPYLTRTSSVNIENENLIKQRITLIFDSEGFNISLFWDRIIFQTSSNLKNLAESNSIVEEPFFSIFKKITSLDEFGNILNCLFNIVTINVNADYKLENFKKVFLKDDLNEILPYKDVAITLNEIVNNNVTEVSFGPYVGIEDLTNRKIKYSLIHEEELRTAGGVFSDLKIVDEVDSVDFKTYQGFAEKANIVLTRIWKRM
ncbi:hypothetical protein [Mucilaginibacter gilvus]|uniref:Uncharacterized protein n=1 Tax=Mucilaginibacter gilvus TaxID=2305909 RepID=A0A3S4YF69_9SPHI|nr:hypothetical protein [Mucilaginibacter gilvus]RWY53882.1 hypothetical protein EPL05_07400 [Mucilaginibacter gilvus]